MEKNAAHFNYQFSVMGHVHTAVQCPQQIGGIDCGVFAVMFAEVLMRRRNPLEVQQKNILYYRYRLAPIIGGSTSENIHRIDPIH